MTEDEIETLSRIFDGNLDVFNEEFFFFGKLNHVAFGSPKMSKISQTADTLIGKTFPSLMKYSFRQEIYMKKPIKGEQSTSV